MLKKKECESLSNRNNLVCDILQHQFSDRFSTNATVCEQHCQSLTWLPHEPPDGVVFIESKNDVIEIVKICGEYHVPVIPFGSGSSLEGQVNAPLGGICLDFSRMNQVVSVYPEDMHAVVEPGVTREMLNKYLRHSGLFFPVDPGAEATLGGMAATRASGTNALRYGTMRENVLSLEVVLANSDVIRVGTRAKKSSAGYDLTKLFVGSEGTLGIITELTLKLYGTPEVISSGICPFPTLKDACNAVILASQLGIDLARVELLDEFSIRACNRYSKLSLPEVPTLFMEFHGSTAHIDHSIHEFLAIVADCQGGPLRHSTNEEDRLALWKARHNAWWAIHSLYPGTVGVSTDICVPISKLAECIQKSQEDIQENQLKAAIIGHVGDGNFHVLVLFDSNNLKEVDQVKAFTQRLTELAISLSGTSTGEHGIGQGKMGSMTMEHGLSLASMRAIKHVFDPKNIMNPGKIFEYE